MRGEEKPPRPTGRSFGAGPAISGNPAGCYYTPQPGDIVGVSGTHFSGRHCTSLRLCKDHLVVQSWTFVWEARIELCREVRISWARAENNGLAKSGCAQTFDVTLVGTDVLTGKSRHIFRLTAHSFCRSHSDFFTLLLVALEHPPCSAARSTMALQAPN